MLYLITVIIDYLNNLLIILYIIQFLILKMLLFKEFLDFFIESGKGIVNTFIKPPQ